MKDLIKLVQNLGSPKVLLAGDFLLDIYVYGDALRISPEAPVPVLKVVKKEHRPGGAASVAADLSALGAKTFCMGVIGKDLNAQILKSLLGGESDTSGLIEVPDRPTITKQRFVGLAQHIHPQQLLRVDEENDGLLTDGLYKQFIEQYKSLIGKVDIVCLQDYNKGFFESGFCNNLIKIAKQAGKKVLIDPAPKADFTKYTGASAITPNRLEASISSGMEIRTIADAAKASEILLKKLNLEAVIITLDKDGAYLKTDDGISQQIPTIPRKVYDVSGAGDVVLAAAAASLAAGLDYVDAVQIANVAGGIEVEKFGTATVSIEEIVNELVSRKHKSGSKIKSIEQLIPQLDWHRNHKQKIVFTNGCFDVLHRGHIEYLSFCKKQGDIVVLGLNSDQSIKAIKGPDRPINNQLDRAAVLAGLECIDYIVIFEEPGPLKLIMQVNPDILVKGEDWAEKGVVGREFVEGNGGKVVLAPLVEGKSSTNTIEKMKSLWNHSK